MCSFIFLNKSEAKGPRMKENLRLCCPFLLISTIISVCKTVLNTNTLIRSSRKSAKQKTTPDKTKSNG